MNEQQKAKELIEKFGKSKAIEVVDSILDELNLNYNEKRIDFYLDVRNLIL